MSWNDEQLLVYDTVEKYSGYEYVGFIDYDEYLIPTRNRTLKELIVSQFDLQYFNTINPFMPNGMSRNDQLEKSISNLRVVWNKFTILFQFLKDVLEANREEPDQTPRSEASDLVLHFFRCPIKRTLGWNGLRFSIQHI